MVPALRRHIAAPELPPHQTVVVLSASIACIGYGVHMPVDTFWPRDLSPYLGLEATPFYRDRLAPLHRELLDHELVHTHLCVNNVRFDGNQIRPEDKLNLGFNTLTGLEFAHLFSVFNGSRVHQQFERSIGLDESPVGAYYTVINTRVLQNQHKNKLGIVEVGDETTLVIRGLYVDRFFLHNEEARSPASLGTVATCLSLITAHLVGLDQVSLIAAGSAVSKRKLIGYKFWPKLGFDADLAPNETAGAEHLADCRTVQDVLAKDPKWWDAHGSQRVMSFPLRAGSTNWDKMMAYTQQRLYPTTSHEPQVQTATDTLTV
jgi:hypothetical protein